MTDIRSTTSGNGSSDELRLLIEQADALAADYEDDVAEALRLGREQPLDSETARSLYTRILSILRQGRGDSPSVAADIRAQVDGLLEAVPRPTVSTELALHERNGLRPHRVVPIPMFNGVSVDMLEGYVDVNDLRFWDDNDRYLLHVQEFRERYFREPEEHELLGILLGEVYLPSLGTDDPFKIMDLAESVARKGVERPPVVDKCGVLKDGHRRTAAARYVIQHPQLFTADERERARWVKVWVATDATEDQIEAIVVGLNFEDDYKKPWPEYVKARRVAGMYKSQRDQMGGRFKQSMELDLRKRVGKHFSITAQAVARYIRMVNWAEDFEVFHIDDGRDPAAVRYRADKIFQWFYELDAGRGDDKLTRRLDQDDELKRVVYDLMWETLDSGAQVRKLYKVVADDAATNLLVSAHGNIENPEVAKQFVKDAMEEVDRKGNTKVRSRAGFDGFLRGVIDRIGGTPPGHWSDVKTELLIDFRRVFEAAHGIIEAELTARETTSSQP